MHLSSPELFSEPKPLKEPSLSHMPDAELDGKRQGSAIAVCLDSIHSNIQPTTDNESFNVRGILLGFVSGGLIWAGLGMLLGVRATLAIMGLNLLLVLAIGTANVVARSSPEVVNALAVPALMNGRIHG